MNEWISALNPFNSMKILIWREWLEALAKGEMLAPLSSDTDPTSVCNFKCAHCNAERYRSNGRFTLSKEQLISLADLHGAWGIKSTCIAGGGEPTLNNNLDIFIRKLADNNVQSGIITNGSSMTYDQMEAITDCSRYAGFSVDTGNADTFIKIKGIKDKGMFDKVINNLSKLCDMREKKRSKVDIAFKYLVTPLNVNTICEAARLAKECGVQHFHLRPGCIDNIESEITNHKYNFNEYIRLGKNEILEAHLLEDDNFKVFAVQHKFGRTWERKINFNKCRAVSLLPTFGADGYCHLCFDLRGKKEFIMCKHEEIIEFWGSEKHREMIDAIDPQKCPRCTFGAYNEIIEKVFIEDCMCRNFP